MRIPFFHMVFVDVLHAPEGGRSGTIASDDLYFPAYSVSIWQERLVFCISMIFFEVLYDYFYYCLLFRLVQKDRKMFVDELFDCFLCVIFLFETHTFLYFLIHVVVFFFCGFHGCAVCLCEKLLFNFIGCCKGVFVWDC